MTCSFEISGLKFQAFGWVSTRVNSKGSENTRMHGGIIGRLFPKDELKGLVGGQTADCCNGGDEGTWRIIQGLVSS